MHLGTVLSAYFLLAAAPGAGTLRHLSLSVPEGARIGVVGRALRQACLGDWLDALPEGLDTWPGDGHAQVSGGERARLGAGRGYSLDPCPISSPEPHLLF